jgi:hypothetical protein
MADRVVFKGTKKLERYVQELSKGMKNGLEDACKELSVKSVMKAREQMQKKSMNLTGQLSQSLMPIPGPYVNKKNGTAKIGFTQQGGYPTRYGNVQEFGNKEGWEPPLGRMVEYAEKRFGLTGRSKWAVGKSLQKDIERRGLKGKAFGFDALKDLVPEIEGKIFSGMRDANNKAVSKANRYNQ